MVKTRVGHLLPELEKNDAKANQLKAAVEAALGEEAVNVKSLTPRKFSELRDLDEVTTGEEIRIAVAATANLPEEEVDVGPLNAAYRGTIKTTVVLTVEPATKLLEVGKITIG